MPHNNEVDLEITNIAHGGVCVARHDGRVVFVSDTLPGERVRARLTDQGHSRFWRAETVEVLEASAERLPHVWHAASLAHAPEHRAGGAEFGHARLAYQRELKRRVIAEAMKRTGHLPDSVLEELRLTVEPAPDETTRGTQWRTRVRLQVDDSGRLGPFASRTHAVVPVSDYPLATTALADAIPFAQRFPEAATVDVVATSAGDVRVLVAERSQRRSSKQVRPARVPVIERVGTREFRVDARGFWQVHQCAASTLSAAVAAAVTAESFDPGAANLDLYGGVGLFAAAVGDRFGSTLRITSVETDPWASDDAGVNLADWVGARVYAARVDVFLRDVLVSASAKERDRLRSGTVVLDPPRSGAGRAVIEPLVLCAPAQIIYVACDPVALARDTQTLRQHGYDLEALRVFDLFPNTHHMEAVATFTRVLTR